MVIGIPSKPPKLSPDLQQELLQDLQKAQPYDRDDAEYYAWDSKMVVDPDRDAATFARDTLENFGALPEGY